MPERERRKMRLKALTGIMLTVLLTGVLTLAFKIDIGCASYISYWQKERVAWMEGHYSSIALDSSGYPHFSICWGDPKRLEYVWWDGSVWNSWEVDYNEDGHPIGLYTSIALDSSDQPHISYYDLKTNKVKYAHWPHSSGWTREYVDYGGLSEGGTSIALDSSDKPHISYYSFTEHVVYDQLKYARKTGSSWSIETVDGSPGGDDAGSFCSLALDSGDKPHISYRDIENGNLKYARKDGGWSIETVDSSGDVGEHTSLALDSSDKPHISYRLSYNAGALNLYYAYKDGEWSIETVDTGYVGDTSIALDSSDKPHIGYFNGLTLMCARKNGLLSDWDIDPVDTGTENRGSTSIVLDSNGYPHISYTSDDDIMHAWQSPAPVGGVWVPVDKLALLAPYVALVSTIILGVSISAAIIKYRKK